MVDRLLLCGATFLSAILTWPAMSAPSVQTSPQRAGEDYNSGAYLYKAFCVSCHGEQGRGDGPVADLSTPRPPNLTTLQRNSGGTFPRARVLAVLDGSAPLSSHDSRAMPNWRNVLRTTEGADERVVRQRLDALVAHVESLQAR